MPYWQPVIIGNEKYSLAHLEPFLFSITPQKWEKAAEVYVQFNDHCFTEKFDPIEDSHAIITKTTSKHEQRAFCLIRYELSKNLPNLIRALDGKRISQTRHGSLVHISLSNGQNYGMFFNLKREKPDLCKMFVISAYPFASQDKIVAVTGEMKFNVAVSLVLAGKKPRFPPKN